MQKIILLFSLCCYSMLMAADPIEKVEENYAKQLKKITEDYERKVSKLNETAVRKLETIKMSYTKAGDLENALKAKTAAEKYAAGIAIEGGQEKVLGTWICLNGKPMTVTKDGKLKITWANPNPARLTLIHIKDNVYLHNGASKDYLVTMKPDGTLWLGKEYWAKRPKK